MLIHVWKKRGGSLVCETVGHASLKVLSSNYLNKSIYRKAFKKYDQMCPICEQDSAFNLALLADKDIVTLDIERFERMRPIEKGTNNE